MMELTRARLYTTLDSFGLETLFSSPYPPTTPPPPQKKKITTQPASLLTSLWSPSSRHVGFFVTSLGGVRDPLDVDSVSPPALFCLSKTRETRKDPGDRGSGQTRVGD